MIKSEQHLIRKTVTRNKPVDQYTLSDIVSDFGMFFAYMFKQMGLPEPTEGQLEMAAFLGRTDVNDKMLLALRGLGKSLTAQLYVLWRLLRNQNEHILVLSGSSRRSKNFTNFCLSMMRSVPLLQHLYPTAKQRKASDHFDVNGSKASDSPNMFAAGIETGLAGFRATIIVSDDIEQPTNSRTPDARALLIHFFNEAINLLISEGDANNQGEVVILGTYQSQESIYKEIEKGGYEVFIVPAEYPTNPDLYAHRLAPYLQKRLKAFPDLAGTAVDQRFPEEVLAKRRLKIGKSAYNLQYLLNPADTDDLKFPLKLRDLIVTDIDLIDNPLRYTYSSENKIKDIKHYGFTGDSYMSPKWESEERMPFEYIAMTVDPSGRGADETGYSIGGLLNGRVFVLAFGGVKGGYDDDTLNGIADMAVKYKVNTIVVESNFGDGAFMKMLTPIVEMRRAKIELEEVTATKNKENRIIDTLEPLMNQHRLIFDRTQLERDFSASAAKYSLSYQLSHMTREKNCIPHDDRVDSLEMLCTHMLEWLDVHDSYGMERYEEDALAAELEKVEKMGMKLFGSFGVGRKNLNFGGRKRR